VSAAYITKWEKSADIFIPMQNKKEKEGRLYSRVVKVTLLSFFDEM